MIAGIFVGGLFAAVFALIFIFVALLPLFCFIDVVFTPSTTFRSAGSSKALWVVLIIWLNILAAFIYLVVVRPRLSDVKART
jgi:hypothetical protein